MRPLLGRCGTCSRASTSLIHITSAKGRSTDSPGAPRQNRQSSCRVHALATSLDEAAPEPVQCQQQRRSIVLGLLAQAALLGDYPARAADALKVYEDASEKFRVSVPEDWVAGEGQISPSGGFVGPSGVRRTLAWYEADKPDVNATVVITNVGADYTSLGSFGTAEQFGVNLVVSMDRSYTARNSWRKPTGNVQRAQLVSTKEVDKMYFVEYAVQKPDETTPRHLVSVVALGFNGRYNRLYTVTAQSPEADFEKYKGVLQQVVKSFRPPTAVM